MYISLEIAKSHLHIDPEFELDDQYITWLIMVAEASVQAELCVNLEDLEDDKGDIPMPVKHAMLLQVGELYNSREINAYGVSVTATQYGFKYLLDPYRNYGDTSSEAFYAKVLDSVISRLYIEKSTGRLLLKEDPSLYVGSKGKAIKRIESELLNTAGHLYLQQNQ
jgi:hypothetical protein